MISVDARNCTQCEFHFIFLVSKMPDDSAESTKMFRIRRTVLEMLQDRQYLIAAGDLEMSKQEFEEKYENPPRRDAMKFVAPKRDDPTDQIIVFFADEAKVGVGRLKQYFDLMEDEKIKRGILVVQDKLTAFAKQTLMDMSPNYVLEEFKENELLVNITHHVLVPKHVLLTPEEKSNLLQRYRLKEDQLPRILQRDPVARYFGLSKGQVVKIIRPSETAGRYITYRFVV